MTLRLNGSTSGYVEIDAPATAGSNTLVLPTGNGTNGQYLQTNGSGALSWATLPASGKILQVVMGTTTSRTTTSSTTFTNTYLNAAITPTSSANKVLIVCHESLYLTTPATAAYLDIARNSTGLAGTNNGFCSLTSNSDRFFPTAITYLDSPATTSAITYTLQIRAATANTVLAGDNNKGVIILMEVAA